MGIKEDLALNYLEGRGIEFGPLNNPLPVDNSRAETQFADRLSKSEAVYLFEVWVTLVVNRVCGPDTPIYLHIPDTFLLFSHSMAKTRLPRWRLY